MKKDILIVGYGYVGSATTAIFHDAWCEKEIFDIKAPYNKKELKSMISHKDFIFICVGTPSNKDGSIDDSAIIETLDIILENKTYFKGIVVIKSTVLYHIIAPYMDKLKIVFNPEFLSQNTFIEDAISQENILLGGDPWNCQKVKELYESCTIRDIKENPNLKFRMISAQDACNFKYIRNIFGAYLVTFWEWVEDQTGNSRLMSSLYKDFPLPSDMSQVGMDGYRGFGGACFPKDVRAWNHIFQDEVTEMLLNYNKKLQG